MDNSMIRWQGCESSMDKYRLNSLVKSAVRSTKPNILIEEGCQNNSDLHIGAVAQRLEPARYYTYITLCTYTFDLLIGNRDKELIFGVVIPLNVDKNSTASDFQICEGMDVGFNSYKKITCTSRLRRSYHRFVFAPNSRDLDLDSILSHATTCS